MSESFEKIPVSEAVVIEALNSKGVEDTETRELLGKYVDQCHAEADMEAAADPESSIASNRANIKAEIKIAVLYSKTDNYKEQARDALEEVYMAASQDESTQDLAQEIGDLLSRVGM